MQQISKKKSILEIPSLLYKSLFVAAVSCAVWCAYFSDYLEVFIVTVSVAVAGCLSSWIFTKRRQSGELYLTKLIVAISLGIKTIYLPFFIWFCLSVINKVVEGEDERLRFCAAFFAIAFLIVCLLGIIKTVKALAGTKGGAKAQMVGIDFNW